MFGHLALVDQDGFRRVDAGGDKAGRKLAGVMGQLGGVLPDGDRMQVDHAIDGFELGFVLGVDKALERAQVIAQMQVARGLDPGKDPWLECRVDHVLATPGWKIRPASLTDGVMRRQEAEGGQAR